jgi:ethanolamine ammonia-lyase large subunit
VLDGLLYGNGDAMIGINPATDSISAITELLKMLDGVIRHYEIPTQSCVLTHVTSSVAAIEKGVPVDLVFQSITGTEAANSSFGISLDILQEGYEAGLSLKRGTLGNNLMYFETGQGSALSANAHHGVDQQTCEAAPTPWHGISIRFWSIPWSASSARNTCTTASRSFAPAWKTISAASCWRAHGLRYLLHQPRRSRSG